MPTSPSCCWPPPTSRRAWLRARFRSPLIPDGLAVRAVVVARLLDLQRGVADAEAVVQSMGEARAETVVAVVGGPHHMGGQRHLGGAHGPDVQVMHLGDAGAVGQEGLDAVEVG